MFRGPLEWKLTDNFFLDGYYWSQDNIWNFLLDKYRQKRFLADAESSQKCWYFSCKPERVLRISLHNVEVSGNAPTNWVHVKVFKEIVGQIKFHQLIILSIWEMRRVLSSLDEVLGEAKRWFLSFLESQKSLKREEMGATREFLLQIFQPLWRTEKVVTISGSYAKPPDEKCVNLSLHMIDEISIDHTFNWNSSHDRELQTTSHVEEL